MEITDKVERMSDLEDKFGVRFEGLFASFDVGDYQTGVTVNFDLVGPASLNQTLMIVLGAYNSSSQLIATTEHLINEDSFIGFDSISLQIDCDTAPARLRLYPKPL